MRPDLRFMTQCRGALSLGHVVALNMPLATAVAQPVHIRTPHHHVTLLRFHGCDSGRDSFLMDPLLRNTITA